MIPFVSQGGLLLLMRLQLGLGEPGHPQLFWMLPDLKHLSL